MTVIIKLIQRGLCFLVISSRLSELQVYEFKLENCFSSVILNYENSSNSGEKVANSRNILNLLQQSLNPPKYNVL